MTENKFPEIWVFDNNRRVYVDRNSGPVWREHWRKLTIVSETNRSWVSNLGWKIPKKNTPKSFAFSEEEIDNLEWIHDNAHKLADIVRHCQDFDKLKKIEAILKEEDKGNSP